MKIALVVSQNMEAGGGFQYELNMVRALINKKSEGNFFLVITTRKENIPLFLNLNVPTIFFRISLIVKFELFLRQPVSLFKYFVKFAPKINKSSFEFFLKKNKIDLVYFLSQNHLALLLDELNYISTVWDLCHRDFPEFPEVRKDMEFENRDNLLHKTLPKSVAVVVDSDIGGKNVARRYLVDEARIITVPYFVNDEEQPVNFNIKEKYGIKGDFIFYPAQFWAHKNHIYILDSLYELKNSYNKKLYAFFPGTDMGNLPYVNDYARKLKIDDQVVFPGFLPRSEIIACYKQALALVYPTYFGPTNIPPLEAFLFDCIVIHTNLEGAISQTKNAALHFDLSDPHSLTEILQELSENPSSFNYLKAWGKKILENCSKEEALKTVEAIVEEYGLKMKTWKMPFNAF
jgi:glycosyltransferase involved in cell wall biosynthesis